MASPSSRRSSLSSSGGVDKEPSPSLSHFTNATSSRGIARPISLSGQADRRKAWMKRTHTLQSSIGNTSQSMDVESIGGLSSSSNPEPEPPLMNPNFLRVPTVFEMNLTELEKPPHLRDVIEKIPMRARSQSWLIRTRHILDDDREKSPIITHFMYLFSVFMIILTFPWCLFFCVKIVKEYQRVVIFRLGRVIRAGQGIRGPGLFIVLPCIDTCKMVDLRVLSFDVPPQEILSRDSVTVSVEAVIYFRINNPVISVTNVNDAQFSTRLLAQTTLRNVLGTKTLSEILAERDAIASVERVEIKDIRLPHQLMKSMAAEAEAARDARARVIAADGEKQASKCLREAADVLCVNRHAVNLRYLQTLSRISVSRNHTLVVPFPVEVAQKLIKTFSGNSSTMAKTGTAYERAE